jgi:porphobilinogen synthase
MASFPSLRLRRLRMHPRVRDLVRETILTPLDFVMPLFIKEGADIYNPVHSMPGVFQISLDKLDQEIASIVSLNIPAVLLFGIPAKKDAKGSEGYNSKGIIQNAIRRIKTLAPDLLIITDVCFCEYTDHGHCGIISEAHQTVDNDKTLEILAKQAVTHAQAGADVIAPSGMIDGMVQAIRHALDAKGFSHIPILSYAVKYASSLYGPFREAAEGAPKFGDRRAYQIDPANSNEALSEAALDVEEGADLLMVKPAGFYLDVISRVKQQYPMRPLGAYQVSGEYSMIKAAAKNGWIDENRVMMESLISIKRAGADFIITYFAKDAAKLLQ